MISPLRYQVTNSKSSTVADMAAQCCAILIFAVECRQSTCL